LVPTLAKFPWASLWTGDDVADSNAFLTPGACVGQPPPGVDVAVDVVVVVVGVVLVVVVVVSSVLVSSVVVVSELDVVLDVVVVLELVVVVVVVVLDDDSVANGAVVNTGPEGTVEFSEVCTTA